MNRSLSFEQRVLAYLGGDLDTVASNSLLQEIHSDPEKERLFESHKALHKMLQQSHGEIAPAERYETELALRLPVLQKLIAVEQPLEQEATVIPTLVRWQSSVSALDVMMMVLSILGLGLVLSSSAPMLRTEGLQSVSAIHPVGAASSESVLYADSRARSEKLLSTLKHKLTSAITPAPQNTHTTPITMEDVPKQPLAVASENLEAASNETSLTSLDALPLPAVSRNADLESRTYPEMQPTIFETIDFKPQLSLFGGMNTSTRLFGNINAVHAASTLADGYEIGLNYEVSPHVAVGLELGISEYAQLAYDLEGDTIPGTTTVARYISGAKIQPIKGLSSKAFTSLMIASGDGFDFYARIEAGLAYLDRTTATAAVGINGRCAISNRLSLFGKILMGTAYVRSTKMSPATYNNIPVDRSAEQPALMTPEVCSGFGFQYDLF